MLMEHADGTCLLKPWSGSTSWYLYGLKHLGLIAKDATKVTEVNACQCLRNRPCKWSLDLDLCHLAEKTPVL